MKDRLITFGCILFAAMIAYCSLADGVRVRVSDDHEFAHPGILHNRAELDTIREGVRGGKEPWASAWQVMKSHDTGRLDWTPKPREHVARGSYNRPNIGASDLMRDGQAAYNHAMQWYITGDENHAEKCIEILNAHAGKLRTVTDHDARLLVGMVGVNFAGAAELMRHTYDGWAVADQQQFENMLREVFYPIIKDFYPTANGNWDAAMIQTTMAIGVFLDDHEIFNRGADYFMNGKGNGAITHYVNETGITQESGRSQGYAQMGLAYLSVAAEIGWKQGLDLYGAYDNRLALGFEYTARYGLGHDVPYEPFRSVEGRYHYREISDSGRGRFTPTYERVYNHYRNRRGLEMPYTAQVVLKTRPEGYSTSHTSWGTLLFAELSDLTGSYRTWTLKQGHTIDARLMKVLPGTLIMQDLNGRTFEINPRLLIENDIEYIRSKI